MYSKEVLKHFQNPHNQGKIKNPTVVGYADNPICSDTMQIYIKIKKQISKSKNKGNEISDNSIIEDVKFETLGCAAAIASSSVLTDMVKGKTISEALRITKDMVSKKLGGLPEPKVHCSLLSVDALHDAINKLIK